MREYYQYGKKHFEFEMRRLLIENKLGFLSEITDEFLSDKHTWERIYKVSTKNPSLDIIIFSSVDIRTNYVRDYSADAVRLVFRWKTKNGYVYKKLAKHLRLRTLFSNVKKTLESAQKQVFNLKGFSRNIE